MVVALAGPLSNLLLAILAAIPFRLGLASIFDGFAPSSGILPTPAKIMAEFLTINLVLMLFNMIPIAPLDGEKILTYFAPPTWTRTLENIRPYGPILLVMIALVLPFLALPCANRWLLNSVWIRRGRCD